MTPRGLLVGFIIFIVSFVYYLLPILKNSPHFLTDEMYWISTARTLHMMLSSDTNNPLWREYYGFANLNGAKLIYGAGLGLMGHADVTSIGVAPSTYYRWVDMEAGSFPAGHAVYPILRDARIISAVFMALTATTVFFIGSIWFPPTAAFAAALITVMHPVSYFIATHVFSDGIFLFFVMCLLLLLLKKENKHIKSPYHDVSIGVVLALIVSTKINGLLFTPLIMIRYLLQTTYPNKNSSWNGKIAAKNLRMFIVGAAGTFILLHPNFFFYPAYSPLQLFKDRIQITNEHIAYFSAIDPPHVTLSLYTRLSSLARHVLPLWLCVLTTLGTAWYFLDLYRNRLHPRLKKFGSVLFLGLYVMVWTLAYTVFDEPRYYFPLIPFFALAASYPLAAAWNKVSSGSHRNHTPRSNTW